MTSIFAIIALIFCKYLGGDFLDAALGIVGSILVAKWAWSLMQETEKTLLDAEMDHHVVDEIRQVLAELPQTTLTYLNVWKIGKGKFSCILALETTVNLTADRVRAMLSIHEEIFMSW